MDLEEQMRRGYRHEVSGRGDCPASVDLVRYHQREVSTEEMIQIKKHINVCGSCDWELAELSEFDSLESPAIPEKTGVGSKGPFVRFLLHPALAYGIVLLLLYPAYVGLFQTRTEPPKIVVGIGSAMDFDLGQGSTTRSATDSTEETLVTLSPAEEFFILTLFVPVRNAHRYEMEIRNNQDDVVESGVIRSRDAIGNFTIVAASNIFPDGHYKLTVREIESATESVKSEHLFAFRVVRNPRAP